MLSWYSVCFLLFRAKYAVGAIKKKVNDKNPHVALYALEVTLRNTVSVDCCHVSLASGEIVIAHSCNKCSQHTERRTRPYPVIIL